MNQARPRPATVAIRFAMIFASQLASTIFLPGMPEIAHDLGITASQVQIIIPAYLGSFAIVQLVAGPLSDRFGRRPVVIGGLSMFAVSSLACALAPDIGTLIIARIFQAGGSCTTIAVGRAIIRDTAEGVAAAQAMTYLAIAMATGPVVAPFVGGIITTYIHWRATFLVTSVVAVVVLGFVLVVLKETLLPSMRNPPGGAQLLVTYIRLLRSGIFVGYSLTVSFASGAMMSFLASAPIVLIAIMGVPPALFGFYVMLMPSCFLVGNYVSSRLSRIMPIDKIILIGVGFSATGGVLQFLLALDGVSTPIPVLLAFATSNFGTGLVLSNCYAMALSTVMPSNAGAASALSGCLHMGWAFIVTLILANVTHTSSLQFSIGQMTTTFLALSTAVVLIFVFKRRAGHG